MFIIYILNYYSMASDRGQNSIPCFMSSLNLYFMLVPGSWFLVPGLRQLKTEICFLKLTCTYRWNKWAETWCTCIQKFVIGKGATQAKQDPDGKVKWMSSDVYWSSSTTWVTTTQRTEPTGRTNVRQKNRLRRHETWYRILSPIWRHTILSSKLLYKAVC